MAPTRLLASKQRGLAEQLDEAEPEDDRDEELADDDDNDFRLGAGVSRDRISSFYDKTTGAPKSKAARTEPPTASLQSQSQEEDSQDVMLKPTLSTTQRRELRLEERKKRLDHVAKREHDYNSEDEALEGRELLLDLSSRSRALYERLLNELEHLEDPAIPFLRAKLKPHQLTGVKWLTLLHRSRISGILADEMGVGKTVQTIAFINWLILQDSSTQVLVVVPVSTLENWVREFLQWAPHIEVCMFYGSQEIRRNIKRFLYDNGDYYRVLLTTYSTFQNSTERRAIQRRGEQRPFDYVILDEAQYIKNERSTRFSRISSIPSMSRLLLTGTPLSNAVLELFTLLSFLMPDIFGDSQDSLRQYLKLEEETLRKGEAAADDNVQLLQSILMPFILRRLKVDVAQTLPPKIESIVRVPMTEIQQSGYRVILQNTRAARAARGEETAGSLSNVIIQLRKMCNHPSLFRSLYSEVQVETMFSLIKGIETEKWPLIDKHFLRRDKTPLDDDELIERLYIYSDFELFTVCRNGSVAGFEQFTPLVLNTQEFVSASAKFIKLFEIHADLLEKGHKILIYSGMTRVLDMIGFILGDKKIPFLRIDGSTQQHERQMRIDRFNDSQGAFRTFLLSTHAAGLGINLTSASAVIFFDVDWNPAIDDQAVDRAHRIGQKNPEVLVYKLVVEKTLDEVVFQRSSLKRERNKRTLSTAGRFADIVEGTDSIDHTLVLEELYHQLDEVDAKEEEKD